MRQHLCIDSVYLNRDKIESIKRNSSEQLVSPWSLEEGEITQPARILSFERISRKGGGQPDSDFIFAGPRSALVRMIRGEDPWRGGRGFGDSKPDPGRPRGGVKVRLRADNRHQQRKA